MQPGASFNLSEVKAKIEKAMANRQDDWRLGAEFAQAFKKQRSPAETPVAVSGGMSRL